MEEVVAQDEVQPPAETGSRRKQLVLVSPFRTMRIWRSLASSRSSAQARRTGAAAMAVRRKRVSGWR
jgi:hypothetical protein